MAVKRNIRSRLGRIKRKILEWLDKMEYLRFLTPWRRKNVYVVGTPVHNNVGDNAIAYAELLFLEACGINKKNIKEITVDEYEKYEKLIVKRLRGEKRLICMHGGGNMGNQWPGEEIFRRHVMGQLDINPMIILPQTFFYTADEKGRDELKKSIPCYNGRKNLTITAREKLSYKLMRESYPDANVILTPDIVLSMNPGVLGIKEGKRKGVLFVMRCDGERVLTDEDTNTVMQTVADMGMEYRVSDMIAAQTAWVDKNKRENVIKEKMSEFTAAELVITDRLHAMVFAAMSNTPCIVLRNNNHKITGTYEWISEQPYIRMAENADEAAQLVGEFVKQKIECHYDHSAYSRLYSDLIAAVKEHSRR